MIIIGHPLINYEKQYIIASNEDIKKTPSNSHLYLKEFDMEMMRYLQDNELSYSVEITKTYQLLIANAMNATYIITNEPKMHQEIATNYLFDSKLLVYIESLEEIEQVVHTNVDGVIFKDAVDGTFLYHN